MIIYARIYKKYYSNCFLQLENMKLELLVIVNKNVTVNRFSGLVHTARHAMEFFFLEKLVNFTIFYGKK
jgi:hypothetical protein